MRLCLLLLGTVWLAIAQDPLASVERLIAGGRFRDALNLLRETGPSNARGHLLAAQAYDGLNDPAQAVVEIEAALAIDPRNEAAYLQLGQIFLSHNTPTAAYEVFDDALRLFPESFLVRLGKGLALKELQRYEEAVTELRVCFRRRPESGITFDALATVYLHAGRFSDLMALAKERVGTSAADHRGYYYLAAAREGLQLPDEETLQLLGEALARKPDFAAGLGLQGKLLLRGGRVQDAVKILERAIELRPDHVQSRLALANAYRRLGRNPEAGREFAAVRELLKKQRQQSSLRYHRGGKDTVAKPVTP